MPYIVKIYCFSRLPIIFLIKGKKMKNVFVLIPAIVFLFGLSGCMGGKLSPKVVNEMNNKKVSKEQVCKGSGRWMKLKSGSLCNTLFYTPTIEDIEKGVRFKRFESTCHEMNGRMKFGKSYNSNNRKKDVHSCNKLNKKGLKREYIFNETEEYFYSDVEQIELKKQAKEESDKRAKIAADKRATAKEESSKKAKIAANKRAKEKAESDKKANIAADKRAKEEAKKVKARMKKLGISAKEVRESSLGYLLMSAYGVKENTPITNKQIDGYLEEKQRQKKEAEFERKAKIKQGKQYKCSDGYDSWVLKYNGERITFGDVNFQQTFGGGYIQHEYDKNPLYIDRAEGVVKYNGNKSTCKPR